MIHQSDDFIDFWLETARLMANADALDAGLERDLDTGIKTQLHEQEDGDEI